MFYIKQRRSEQQQQQKENTGVSHVSFDSTCTNYRKVSPGESFSSCPSSET